jgi:hypothetical protein
MASLPIRWVIRHFLILAEPATPGMSRPDNDKWCAHLRTTFFQKLGGRN